MNRNPLPPPPELLTAIRSHKSFLLTTHRNPDGDGLGSCLALALGLRAMGKEALVVNADKLPDVYVFLPGSELVRPVDSVVRSGWDVMLAMDASNWVRMNFTLEWFEPEPLLLNIDHHQSNDRFGKVNWVDETAATSGTLTARLLDALGVSITKEMAVNIYTALLTDTGNFKYSNTDAESFALAGRLLATGIEPHKISQAVFQNMPLRQLQLHGLAFHRICSESDGRLLWTFLEQEDFAETGAIAEDTEGIINTLQSVSGMRLAVFFRTKPDGSVKVSFRGREEYDVAAFAAQWGGGGHPRASGCDLKRATPAEAREEVLTKVREFLVSNH